MKIKKISYSLLFFFLSFCAISQEKSKSDAGGPPTLKELVGFWKMIDLPNKEKMNKVNPWPQPYQWFVFYENGKIYSMMNSQDGAYSTKELAQIFEVLPKDKTPNYKLDGQFVIIDNPEIKDYQEIWGVNIFAKDIGSKVKKGDLIMSLDDGNGKAIYYRLLRRIQ
jgi:hypothetical protein